MRLFGLILFLVATYFQPSLASTATYHTKSQDIDAIIAKTDPNLNIGMEVLDLTTGNIIYQRHAQQNFVPASNLKLLSTAAALLYLTPSYQFDTRLIADLSKQHNHSLETNLYLKLVGDPSLSSQDLATLIESLAQHHIKKIHENIIIDDHLFAKQTYAPGWMLDDIHYGYGAPNGPVLLDENQISVVIKPAKQLHQLAKIKFTPTPIKFHLDNKLVTEDHQQHCHINIKMNQQNRLSLSGCLKQDINEFIQTIAIRNPKLYMVNVLQAILKNQHIKLDGKIVYAQAPVDVDTIAQHFSPLLTELIHKTLKQSDNLYADAIFLKLSQLYYDQAGTWSLGSKAVQTILHEYTNIDFSATKIVDGSGLSRYNLVTPEQFVKLLAYMSRDFAATYEFISALPVAGRDTHLAFIANADVPRHMVHVRAKTGTMTGVSSLSGYLYTEQQHILAFSMMMNGFTGPMSRYHALEKKLCNYFVSAS